MEFNSGDIYIYQTPNGYYSAIRVLITQPKEEYKLLVYSTRYFNEAKPDINNPQLYKPLDEYSVEWIKVMKVSNIYFVGNQPLEPWEEGIYLRSRKLGFGYDLHSLFLGPYYRWLEKKDPEAFEKVLEEDETGKLNEFEKSLPSKAFWEIISLIDFDADDPLEKARDKLASMTEKQIIQFEKVLAQKLYKLDTEKHARSIGEAAYVDEETFFSPDFFLYARCLAVAKGKDFYEHVVKHPEAMPKDDEFEELLTLAAEAFEEKTKDEWDYVPSKDYETFSNERGWR